MLVLEPSHNIRDDKVQRWVVGTGDYCLIWPHRIGGEYYAHHGGRCISHSYRRYLTDEEGYNMWPADIDAGGYNKIDRLIPLQFLSSCYCADDDIEVDKEYGSW